MARKDAPFQESSRQVRDTFRKRLAERQSIMREWRAMRSEATDVADYVSHLDEIWRPTVERLRVSCLEHLLGSCELMAYGMPTYEIEGRPLIAFARQVRFLSLYVMKKGVLDAYRSELADLSVGKGCIRFQRPEQINWTLVESLLRESADSRELPC